MNPTTREWAVLTGGCLEDSEQSIGVGANAICPEAYGCTDRDVGSMALTPTAP